MDTTGTSAGGNAGLTTSASFMNKNLLELDLDYLERRGGEGIPCENADSGSKEEDSPADSLDRVKVVFLGAPGVGKSSIVRQFVWSEFSEEYKPTERRETFYPSVVLAERLYELKISDLPAIPYFPVSSHLEWTDFRYYGLRSATAYVLVFDLSNQDTFQYIRTLREQIYEARDMRGVPLLVVGNKQDKLSASVASGTRYRDIVNLVRKHWRCGYVECSAKFNCRVVQVFRELMKGIQAVEGRPPSPSPTPSQPLRAHPHNSSEKTRGTPSTSLNLKEALCEKIPLHHDLLRKFRLRHGTSVVSQITVGDLYQGLKGVGTTVRETSEIDPKVGVKYRGLTIPEVVAILPRRGNSPCPEAVFWLLLTGDIPTHEQTASLTADWTSRRQRRREWWSEKGGGIIGVVLQALPKTMSPLGRLCVALTTLGADKHIRKALKCGAISHTHWEYTYEDCMEVLAVLPAIVGLVSKTQDFNNIGGEGDWVDVLLDCLGNISSDDKGKRSSLGEFLRLYIAVNADEDGSSPGAHTTQILGDATLDPSQALAAGVLAYGDEPKGGSMVQYMEFQTKLYNALGCRPTKNVIQTYLGTLIDQENDPTGYKESEFCDPRYIMLRNYARENLPEAPEVKLSRTISKVFIPMLRQAKTKNSWPEQNAIAAPIFQFYGLRDMEFNQVLLCMSRALGAIASMIWARAMNAPVERPKSSSTYTYMDGIYKMQQKSKKYSLPYVKHISK